MIGDRVEVRGQNWSIFFGVAAIVIGALVLVSRVLVAVDGRPSRIDASALVAPTPSVAARLAPLANKPLELAESDIAPPLAHAGSGAENLAAIDSLAPEDVGQPALPACPSSGCQTAEESPQAPPSVAPAPEPPGQPAPPAPAVAAAPAVSAQSVAIIERSCGSLVYGLNENERLPPASLTKIMTAMLVAERASLDTMVDIKDISAKYMIKTTDSSVMGIEPGMRFSVRDLLYGLILPSGNDAALVLAQQVAGSTSNFVALMNARAAALGMTNSHFTNPHGLDDPDLYSSALDLAKAGRAYLEYPVLLKVSIASQYETPGAVRILMKNGNKLLQTYPGAYGVKIGYTTNAKQTIVAAANHNGRELIVALLGSEDRFADSTVLLDWAFANTPRACN